MLSRVANSVYWMNRYMERIENYARFVSVNINLSYDLPGLMSEQWLSLLEATGDKEDYLQRFETSEQSQVIDYLTFDNKNFNSIFSCLSWARENARTIRETLPKELWEHVNGFYLNFKTFASKPNRSIDDLNEFYENIKEECQLFTGMMEAAHTRNEAYYFGNTARMLERADKTSRFLDIGYFKYNALVEQKEVDPKDLLIWSAVLKSVSAFNMYRQQYKNLNQKNIIEFLIKDHDFPRAMSYAVKKAEYSLYRISGARIQDSYSNQAEKSISQHKAEIDFTEINDITKIGLHKFLTDFQKKINITDDEIHKMYFE